MTEDEDFELDDAAQALFAELGGVEYTPRMKDNLIRGASTMAEALGEEERIMDEWRILLVEFAHFLSVMLAGFRMPGSSTSFKEAASDLDKTLDKLSSMPQSDGTMLVRYRGMGGENPGAQKYDYVIGLGNLEFDMQAVKAVAKRRGLNMSHLPGRLSRAFEAIASLGVNTIHINMGKWRRQDANRTLFCLQALRVYFQTLESGKKVQTAKGPGGSPAVVMDETSRPNPNLTLLAALNKLNLATVKGLIAKVSGMMQGANSASTLENYASVYEAVFAFKNLRDKLVKPPVEVNNVRWLIIRKDQDVANKDEIRVARKVMEKFGASPDMAARVVDSLYGKDMGHLAAKDLDGRLEAVSSFLSRIDGEEPDEAMINEVLGNIEQQLDEVPDDVLEDLDLGDVSVGMPGEDDGIVIEIDEEGDEEGAEDGFGFQGAGELDISEDFSHNAPGNGIEFENPGFQAHVDEATDSAPFRGEELLQSVRIDPMAGGAGHQPLNAKLYEVVSFFKHRSGTKRKIKQMLRQPIDFDAQDFEVIAKDFDVPISGAEELLNLLRGCFDKEGRFLRKAFETSIPRFARYEKKVFEFLWHYLKEIMQREDRVAFLNALQLLIAKMNQPQKALEVLLKDFTTPADQVTYSDRNALMLANILLRKYNQELRNDVEITPEEVLLVKDGLNREVVRFARDYVEIEQERLFEKIRAIHKELKEAMSGTAEKSMPTRYLSTLEREVYIFLSLVAGRTARAILKSSVKEYGTPGSEVYYLDKSPNTLKTNMQLLQVTIRGLARFRDDEDAALFGNIRNRRDDFLAMSKDAGYQELVRRVMKWT